MSRTTLNIDARILIELKEIQRVEHKPLGKLVSELLNEALAFRRRKAPAPVTFRWISKSMKARVDLTDKDAVYAVLDQDAGGHEL